MRGGNPIYSAQALVAFAAALLGATGLDDEKAATVAEVLLEGDLLGHSTHGLALAAPYLRALEDGGMTRDGEPAVVSDHGGALCWDGRRLPGPWLVVKAIDRGARACVRARHRRGRDPKEPSHRLPRRVPRARHGARLHDPPDLLGPVGGERGAVWRLAGLVHARPDRDRHPDRGRAILIDMSASITTNGTTARLRDEGRRFPGQWDDRRGQADRRSGRAGRRPARHAAAHRRARARPQGLQSGARHRGARVRGSRATAAPTRQPAGALRSTSRSWSHGAFGGAHEIRRADPASSPRPAAGNPPAPGVDAAASAGGARSGAQAPGAGGRRSPLPGRQGGASSRGPSGWASRSRAPATDRRAAPAATTAPPCRGYERFGLDQPRAWSGART